ncbi:oxidoreductase [Sphingomonas sp.]|uniref:oxidoreductase n=1 Tax=Sphingomonas sp. TaxID=28214 RepID=UPI001D74335D|nr:oxidoreductase [Sphingomonas sp.]MBX9797566.1 SDR family NAD(P)-dependent oxidoreductase [Sphingomonas sp.]
MVHDDKIWFITGATSGFGLALAEEVLARGARAVLVGRRADRLAALAMPHGDRALPIAIDVTDAAARNRAVAEALEKFGRIDVLANIAGRGSLGAVEEFAADQLRDQLELNFFAAAELTRAVLPAMRAQRSGHILNLTSVGGLVSMGGFGAYCAAKFALEAWSEALRDEVAPLGIRVTLVEPGAFRTEFAGDVNMRPAHPIAAYRGVIAPVEDYLYGSAGAQPGDPAKAAQLMIAVTEAASAPMRLMMGADAFGMWEQTLVARLADLDTWKAAGIATAFEPALADA